MSRTKKIGIVIVSLVIIIVASTLILVRYLSDPVQGKVFNNMIPIPSRVTVFNLKPVTVVGKYITFNYPASLKTEASLTNSSAIPESHLYSYQDTETWQLAISVVQLSQPSLNSNSGYSQREQDPSRYQESTITFGSNTFFIMKDLQSSGFSQVAFAINGTISVDISLYGNDQTSLNNLKQTFNMVLSSFKWQQ